jgi:SNF2 family DNA or RNA helicase
MELYKHQQDALNKTFEKNKVAYYHDMGLGKTFTGSEKMHDLGKRINLVVCQKSKIKDWVNHLNSYYPDYRVFDLSLNNAIPAFLSGVEKRYNGFDVASIVGIINYDLIFRRKELLDLKDFTLMLDESSLIQNPTAKRTKFIMAMQPDNVILLSGTPTGGKYERLITQMNLLGWKITEQVFWNQYVNWEWNETDDGFWQKKILGYKNEERLKHKMRKHGCDFLKTEDVFDLPKQIDQKIKIPVTKNYLKFKKNSYIEFDDVELVGDSILIKMLYERQLCGQYNSDKLSAFKDLLESTNNRLIVFYNFTAELNALEHILKESERSYSIVNGQLKDLYAYENNDDSVTLIQYQAGAMGLNLQKANKIIYFTPPLGSELFEQSKKRIHRIGQDKPCFYYYLVCSGSIEEQIYRALSIRRDYTEALFEGGE